MGRVLAIDFGTKRCGIAVTDPLQLIASGLTTIPRKELMDYLAKYFQEETVDQVLFGEPKQKDGTPSDVAPLIEAFIRKFKVQFPEMKVARIDERYSSKMAFQSMIDGGLSKKKRQNKGLIDEISATLILQDYLQYHK